MATPIAPDPSRRLRHRPRAHFQPPSGWINDPNGPLFWTGRWHLFYQCNPSFAGFPPDMAMHWGHAVSANLVDWVHQPLALSPAPGDADASGCWSGSVVVSDGEATALYSTSLQSICRARSRDPDLRRWTKAPEPVIEGAPAPWDRQHFRDPFVFAHDGAWLMCVAGQHAGRGIVWLLGSADLERWEPIGELLADDPAWPWRTWRGVLWECPALVPVGDRWALLVGAAEWGVAPSRALAFVGRFDGRRFHPESCELYDHGLWYAPICARHDGRVIAFGWVPESCGPWDAALRTNSGAPEQGWAGLIALPHELALDARGRLASRIVREAAALRDGPTRRSLDGLGDSAEIRCAWSGLSGAPVGVVFLASADGGEATRVVIDPTALAVTLDRSRSSLDPAPDRWPITAAIGADDLDELELCLVIDRSVVHLIVNERVRITARVYPSGSDCVHWTWLGRPADRIEAWPLRMAEHQREAWGAPRRA